ncbi:MAG: glyoxylate/hydroxypyruvate reductase A, partial [Pseudomonadota bacterium]
MTVVLFSGPGEQPDLWREALTRISEELEEEITLHTDPAAVDPAAVEVLIVNPNGPEKDFRRFPNLRLIQSIWAGVEVFMGLDLPDVPLCRMVEPGLTEGMTEYIVGHVLLHHMGVPRQVAENQNADWNP